MLFSDLALARRLERAEGYACQQYAAAHRRVFPDSHTEWLEYAGAYAVFDGIESPITQTFGLGLFEELTAASLDVIEKFFHDRSAPANHEVSPFAGVEALKLLCSRHYKPIETSSVMYKQIANPPAAISDAISVRVIGPEEAQLWSDTSAAGWAHEHPELLEFLKQAGVLCTARHNSPCFLAELNAQPGAAGALCLHEGVALFVGAATIPELRRQGLQGALLVERMRYAFEQGCDLAMMVAEVGGSSQRNAERQGFRIAYTRTKWQLQP
jgi:hypothetical protein